MNVNKNKILKIIVTIFLFVALLDPSNIFIGIKHLLFILLFVFLLMNYPLSNKYLGNVLSLISIFVVGFIWGRFYGLDFDITFFKQSLSTFLFLLLLLWFKRLSFYKYILYPSLVLSIFTISIYIIFVCFPEFSILVYNYISSLSEHPVVFIQERIFLGFSFQMIFYTPIVINLITLPISLDNYLETKKTKMLLCTIVLTLGLFCAGNRACLLSLILVYSAILLERLWRLRYLRGLISLCVFMFFFFFLILFNNVVQEKEESNNIKRGHIESYIDLLHKNPNYYITGTGAGTYFYSKGFGRNVPQTEITYLEILRMYGLFGGFFIFLFFVYPAYYILKYRKKYKSSYPVAAGLIIYILSSSGNPYLFSSTGMIVVMSVYQYMNQEKLPSYFSK